jgi:hypothetical protein
MSDPPAALLAPSAVRSVGPSGKYPSAGDPPPGVGLDHDIVVGACAGGAVGHDGKALGAHRYRAARALVDDDVADVVSDGLVPRSLPVHVLDGREPLDVAEADDCTS